MRAASLTAILLAGSLALSPGAGATTTSFANPAANTINDNTSATPYPSPIVVSGQAGIVTKATVTLTGYWHTCPWDVSALLVGPGGRQSLLMGRLGQGQGCPPASGANLTFDDAAASNVPYPPVTGTWKPTSGAPASVFPAPAPAGPYTAALSQFDGTNPNGTWSRYVVDASTNDTGTIAGGWSLHLDVTSPAASVSPTTVSFGNQAIATTVEQTVTVTSSGGAPLTVGTSAIAGSGEFTIGSDGCASKVLAPAATCQLTVRFTPTGTAASTATLTVPSDDPTSPLTVALSGTGIPAGSTNTTAPATTVAVVPKFTG